MKFEDYLEFLFEGKGANSRKLRLLRVVTFPVSYLLALIIAGLFFLLVIPVYLTLSPIFYIFTGKFDPIEIFDK